jgi:GPH family glycoside/pentoside/hexuronide:cation symporter
MSSATSEAIESGPAERSRISQWQAAGWGVGSLATATMLLAPSGPMVFVLVSMVKLEPVFVGALVFAGKIVDVLTDPPVGALSDRTRSPLGRRRPWLLGSSFICGLVFALLFNIPDIGTTGIYIYVGCLLALHAVSYTCFQIPYMAMPAEMTDDYHQRTMVMSWRVVFMSVGNLAGAAGLGALAKSLGGEEATRASYGEAGVIIGCLITVLMLATFFFTKNTRSTQAVQGQDEIPLRQHLRWIVDNRPLLVLIGTKIAIYVGVFSSLATALFFYTSVLKLNESAFFMVMGLQMATTIAFMPVCNWLSKQIGKKPAYVLSLGGFGVVAATWLLAGPNEPTQLLLARAFCAGAFGAGAHLYGQSMLIDTFALDHQLTGQRREGVLSATFSFVEKMCMALGPFIVGALLSMLGFDKELAAKADQSDSAVLAIQIGYIWIPVACNVAAIFLLKFYHLSEQDLQKAGAPG